MHAENLTVTAVAELLAPLFRYVWECGTGLDNLSRPEIEGGMAKTVTLLPQQPEADPGAPDDRHELQLCSHVTNLDSPYM